MENRNSSSRSRACELFTGRHGRYPEYKISNYLTLQDFQNFIGQDIMDADEDATGKTNRFQNNKP